MFKSLNRSISAPIAIIIIVALAVIVGGGILVYQYKFAPEEPESILTPTSPPKDETADWKTYRNEKYGFEIEYPKDSDFKSIDYTDPDDLRKHNINPEYSAGNLLLTGDFDFTSGSDYFCAGYRIRVEKTDYQDINNWVEDMRQKIETPSNYEGEMISGKLTSVEDMDIQGRIAKRITTEKGYPFMNAYLGVINKDKLYTISYFDMSYYERPGCFEGDVKQGESKYKDIFDKLLSTFKFLE